MPLSHPCVGANGVALTQRGTWDCALSQDNLVLLTNKWHDKCHSYGQEWVRMRLCVYTISCVKYLQLTILQIALLAIKGKENIFISLQQLHPNKVKICHSFANKMKCTLKTTEVFIKPNGKVLASWGVFIWDAHSVLAQRTFIYYIWGFYLLFCKYVCFFAIAGSVAEWAKIVIQTEFKSLK